MIVFIVIEELTVELGSYLSQAPIKMESLMQESKQKMTKNEKRRAEREYKNEKETVGTHGIYNGRGRPRSTQPYSSRDSASYSTPSLNSGSGLFSRNNSPTVSNRLPNINSSQSKPPMVLFPTNRTPPSTTGRPTPLLSSTRSTLPDRLLPPSNRFVQFPTEFAS